MRPDVRLFGRHASHCRIIRKESSIAATIEAHYRICHSVEQIAIVRDEHQRAGKLKQRFLKNFECGNVEVVGGLVEDEHVGRLQHESRYEHPSALAPAEPGHRLIELFVVKRKRAAYPATWTTRS